MVLKAHRKEINMKKRYTKTCTLCGKKVTQSQLNHAEAIKTARGKYTHTDCIDDLSRHPNDAHYLPQAKMSNTQKGDQDDLLHLR